MKKKVYILFISLLTFVIGMFKVSAGSLTISGNDSVYLNSTITIKVNFSNIAGRFKISSSNSSVLSGSFEDFYDNQSVTFTFTAKSVGTATINVVPVGTIGDYDNDVYTGGGRSINVTVLNRNKPQSIDVNRTYSKNKHRKTFT